MNRSEAFQQYQKSYRAGQKYCRACMISGSYPYIRVLDEILDESTLIGRMDLGVMEIPTELIIGTKHAERRLAFAANYMPLLPSDTEFAAKWISLCAAHLSEEGINDPISCYEYMGEFYVQEGHKRVSVLRSYGAAGVSARVVRLVPAYSDDVRVRVYYEFMDFFALTRLYSVDFRRPGGYAKLLEALGCEPGRTWTDSERQSFAASFMRFGEAFRKLNREKLPVTAAEALLVWLRVYKMPDMKAMMMPDLVKSIESVWGGHPPAGERRAHRRGDRAAGADGRGRPPRAAHAHHRAAAQPPGRGLRPRLPPGVQPVDHHARHGAPVPGKPAGRRDNRPLLRPGAGPGPGGADGKGRGGGGGRHLRHRAAAHRPLPENGRAAPGGARAQLLALHALCQHPHLLLPHI